MSGIAVAGIALVLYLWERSAGIAVVLGVGFVVLLVTGLAVRAGASLGHQTPSATRWLLWLWTPGVLIVLGAATAVLAHLSTLAVAGEKASDSTKTIAALIAAILVAVGTQAKDWLPKHLAPWLAKKVVCSDYPKEYFPCLPSDMPKGAAAWELVSEACTSDAAKLTGPNLQLLLQAIKDAVEAKQTAKDSGWKCA